MSFWKDRVISTVDHPYASPPLRLLSAHHNFRNYILKSGLKPYVCIWDVNIPSADRYTYELNFDSGIIAAKSIGRIFQERRLYPFQTPRNVDFPELREYLAKCLGRLSTRRRTDREPINISYLKNFDALEPLYAASIASAGNGSDFYFRLLPALYRLVSQDRVADFFSQNAKGYFLNRDLIELIVWGLAEAAPPALMSSLLSDEEVFTQPHLRRAEDGGCVAAPYPYAPETLDRIRSGGLIPSYQLLFCAMAFMGIRHFGNDYGFFGRLAKRFPVLPGVDIPISGLQVVPQGLDSSALVEFSDTHRFSLVANGGEGIGFRMANPKKHTRTASMPALYLTLGNRMSRIVSECLADPSRCPVLVKMAE